MKKLLLILSLYLLVVPALACAETDGCKEEQQSTVSKTADHDEHEDENCSNFCNCSCCVHIVTVNFQLPAIATAKPLFTNKALSLYHNISLPSNYFGNIWQPPRLG